MDCAARHREIEMFLLAERKASVERLCRRFRVSSVTIRKDLAQLESRGLLLRTHGGAVLAERPEWVVPHTARSQENLAGKAAVARAAALRIKDGEHILLDAGSTTLALARELRGRPVTIVTNSVPVAMELAGFGADARNGGTGDDGDEKASVIVLGGNLRRASLALLGPLALRQMESLHCDRAFLGASGFDARTGFSCQNLVEAESKRAMARTAREVVMLADHSKFERTSFAPFCALKDLDVLITDVAPPRSLSEALKKARVEVVVAE